jgi:hypothetical protein
VVPFQQSIKCLDCTVISFPALAFYVCFLCLHIFKFTPEKTLLTYQTHLTSDCSGIFQKDCSLSDGVPRSTFKVGMGDKVIYDGDFVHAKNCLILDVYDSQYPTFIV